MKRMFNFSAFFPLAVAICLLVGCASPQTGAGSKKSKTPVSADQIPVAVKAALHDRFPEVIRSEWKLKSGGIYEAEFMVNKKEITVMFDASGKWLETETAIDPASVPPAVNEAAATKFQGYTIVETQSVQQWDRSELIYELHLENAKEIAKVHFSRTGAILKQSAKPKL